MKNQYLFSVNSTIFRSSHCSEMTLNFRAKIFKQKMCFRAIRYQYKVKIDISYIKNSCGKVMMCRFFFLLETSFLGSHLELLRNFSIFYADSYIKSCSKRVKKRTGWLALLWKINRMNNYWKTPTCEWVS